MSVYFGALCLTLTRPKLTVHSDSGIQYNVVWSFCRVEASLFVLEKFLLKNDSKVRISFEYTRRKTADFSFAKNTNCLLSTELVRAFYD
jgi:hypothetical protein